MDQKAKGTAKDFFFYLSGFAALYVSVISLISLLFEIVNKLFPDMISNGYYYAGAYSTGMRFAIASLIIVFPLYLFVAAKLDNYLRANPEKKDVAIRKWLTYLTLFLTGAAVVTDLIVLVNSFLGGEITTRFVLKVLAVLVVTGGVFGYYLYDLRKVFDAGTPKHTKLIVSGASIFVFLSLVGGFMIMGSPITARSLKFDDTRVSDLQNIQWQLVTYWQQKKALPEKLSLLTDSISGYYVPLDPQTGKEYTYEKTGLLAFNLCADFTLPSRKDPYGRGLSSPTMYGIDNDTWQHEAGTVCFKRTIDPDKYPVFEKGISR